MYASEAELNEVESKLAITGLIANNLEAQIEGTYSFDSAQSKFSVIRRIQEANFYFLECNNIHDILNEYVIAPREPVPAEAQPAAPATAQVAGGVYVPCGGEPIDMFVKGWLNSPLTKFYAGQKITVSHHSKDGNYIVEVDGQTQASVSEVWFWRHVADGYRQAAADAQERAAAIASELAESKRLTMYLEDVESRYKTLREFIGQQYCEAFGLAWVNVPLEMAITLLVEYAKPEWERQEAELQASKVKK